VALGQLPTLLIHPQPARVLRRCLLQTAHSVSLQLPSRTSLASLLTCRGSSSIISTSLREYRNRGRPASMLEMSKGLASINTSICGSSNSWRLRRRGGQLLHLLLLTVTWALHSDSETCLTLPVMRRRWEQQQRLRRRCALSPCLRRRLGSRAQRWRGAASCRRGGSTGLVQGLLLLLARPRREGAAAAPCSARRCHGALRRVASAAAAAPSRSLQHHHPSPPFPPQLLLQRLHPLGSPARLRHLRRPCFCLHPLQGLVAAWCRRFRVSLSSSYSTPRPPPRHSRRCRRSRLRTFPLAASHTAPARAYSVAAVAALLRLSLQSPVWRTCDARVATAPPLWHRCPLAVRSTAALVMPQ
jgi:hypothetical protein